MYPDPYTRRRFLTTSTQAAGAIAGLTAGLSLLPRPLYATLGTRPEPVPVIQDPRVKALTQRAIQAAREAGATFADIRLTYTRTRVVTRAYPQFEDEVLHAGVRALVNGYWGFAASPVWHPDEMVRLGREATQQARINALGKPREFYLPPVTPVIDGHWETPVRIDAFAVHPKEIRDFFLGLNEKMLNELRRLNKFGGVNGPDIKSGAVLTVQEKAFASSDGTYCTQRLHRTTGDAQCRDADGHFGTHDGLLTFTGAGWEHIKDAPIIDTIRRTLHENLELAQLPVKPIDIGRHDTVFDAYSVAALLSRTVGAATELDRALGYEANAGGTSYLSAPPEMLGTFPIGNTHLTVTANRGEPGGVSTTQWDDEGVAPVNMTLIQNGILNDFQTSREGAGWLRETYTRANRPVQSHGCAFATTASDLPLIHTANLVMRSGEGETTLRDLEAEIGKGMSVAGMTPSMDFQCLNGSGTNMTCFEIQNGKRVARVVLADLLFRTPELLKGITAVGGPLSARRYGFGNYNEIIKGEPVQYGAHSVTAIPVAIKEVSFINAAQR